MAIDYTGMFTGERPNPSAGVAGMPRDLLGQTLQGIQQGEQRAQQGMGSLFGTDFRSPAEQVKEQLTQLNPNSIEDQPKIVSLLRGVDPQASFAMEEEFKVKNAKINKAQKLRNGLLNSAKSLGLTATVESLQSGGSVLEAEKTVYKEQERQMVSRGGRKGKLSVAKSKNASPETLASIKAGDFDEMTDTLFIEQLEGKKATIKAFRDSDGTIRSRRVDEQGNAWSPESNKWESPLSLGLSPAPTVTKALSAADSITEKLTDAMTTNFLGLNEQAQIAEKILRINADSMDVLDRGIVSGFTAPIQLELLRIGKTLGVLPQDMEDTVAATELFMISRAKQVLPLIKALGSGTAISDKDREFIEKVVAGNVSLDKDTIMEVIRIESQYARDAINKNNTALDTLNKVQGTTLDPAVYESLYIQSPEQTNTQQRYSTGAASYLERIKNR